MIFNKGDIIIGTQSHNKDVVREIVKRRKHGYDWKYPDIENGQIYMSENSSDPLLEIGWEIQKGE